MESSFNVIKFKTQAEINNIKKHKTVEEYAKLKQNVHDLLSSIQQTCEEIKRENHALNRKSEEEFIKIKQ
jgi:hypothetical protein